MVRSEKGDRLLFLLEAGLCTLIVLAPLPFGSVGAGGRLALELHAFALTALWMFTATRCAVALPPRMVCIALLALLAIALVQLLPIGAGAVSVLSPRATDLRSGLDPIPDTTLSLAPEATASALRTGSAIVGVVFVATSVVAARGAKRLALAALASAAFQGLYGLLVLASGHDRIWNVPKVTYLDSATGTFINRNHFAGFLSATLPLGVGLVVAMAGRARGTRRARQGVITALGPEGTRALMLALLALIGAAGLLLSMSRAGTALGLLAIVGTAAVSLRAKPMKRLGAIALVMAIAAVPLLDIGADRLASRFATTGHDFAASGGRWDVARDTLGMIAAFPVTGVGFGAFNWSFPAFRSKDVRLHYTHAHNDLLQIGAEGGVPALALLGVILAVVGPLILRAARDGSDPLATGAAFGLSALLVHALVDFNFHIPANAAIAALLAGVLLGATWNGRS